MKIFRLPLLLLVPVIAASFLRAQQPAPDWTPRGIEVLGREATSRTEFTLDRSMLVFAAKMDQDNLDLERWFRLPKSHERRIHGHRHAGVRIVQEGPTLVHALDAHIAHPEPFTVDDLLPYRTAREPPSQKQAMDRRKIMRKARSPKKRPVLLAELERRYRESPES